MGILPMSSWAGRPCYLAGPILMSRFMNLAAAPMKVSDSIEPGSGLTASPTGAPQEPVQG